MTYERFPAKDCKHRPLFGHVLLQLESVREKSKGGVIIPSTVKDDNEYTQHCAKLVAIGDLAFCDKDSGEPWKCEKPKVGDIVRIPIHGGDRFKVDGTVFVFFRDRDLCAVVDLDQTSD